MSPVLLTEPPGECLVCISNWERGPGEWTGTGKGIWERGFEEELLEGGLEQELLECGFEEEERSWKMDLKRERDPGGWI